MAENLIVTGIEFDTQPLMRGVEAADKKLKDLEKQVDETAKAAKQAERKYSEFAATTTKSVASVGKAATDGLGAVTQETTRTLGGLGRLNNAFVTLAREATGAHPAVAQLTNVVGAFAVGTGFMVPVLAGFAAIGMAWQKMTEDARRAREEAENAIAEIDKLARVRALGPGVPEAADREIALRVEQRHIERKLQGVQADIADGVDPEVLGALQAQERDLQQQLDRIVGQVRAANALTVQAQQEFQRNIAQAEASNLAALISTNSATDKNVQRARALIAQFKSVNSALGAGEQTREVVQERARLANQIQLLEGAFTKAVPKETVSEIERLTQGFREQRAEVEGGAEAALKLSRAFQEATATQQAAALEALRGAETAQAQKKAENEATRAAEQNAKAVADQIRQLEEKYILLYRGADALLEYTLRQRNASEEDIRAARVLAEKIRLRERELEVAKKAAEEMQRLREQSERESRQNAERIAGHAGDAFTDWVTGAQSAEQAFSRMVDSMIRDLIRLAAQEQIVKPLAKLLLPLIGSFVGGGGAPTGTLAPTSGIKFAAMGGPVTGGDPYIVGERGPELFVPRASGSIVPNHALGGGQVVHVHMTVPITVQSLDARTAYEIIVSQRAAVAQAMLDAVKTSSSLRAHLRG